MADTLPMTNTVPLPMANTAPLLKVNTALLKIPNMVPLTLHTAALL